jgi:hypothetical protein
VEQSVKRGKKFVRVFLAVLRIQFSLLFVERKEPVERNETVWWENMRHNCIDQI